MEKCANLRKDTEGRDICGATEYAVCSETCPFYITATDAKASLEKANARLNTLTATEQLGISQKYYDGKAPWKNNC